MDMQMMAIVALSSFIMGLILGVMMLRQPSRGGR